MNTRLIHATAYRPQGKGKVERLFLYVDRSFKPEAYLLINQGKLTTLEDLNQHFWAWLEKAYHTRVHGTTKQTPRVRFAQCEKELLFLDPVQLDCQFLWEETRKADATACISLQGNSYEVDLSLAKKTVLLRYNPQDLSRLEVWHEGVQYPDALPLNLSRPRHKALPVLSEEPSAPATGLNFLEAAKAALAKEQAEEVRNSLSFVKLSQDSSGGTK